jgi:hypothetical protein
MKRMMWINYIKNVFYNDDFLKQWFAFSCLSIALDVLIILIQFIRLKKENNKLFKIELFNIIQIKVCFKKNEKFGMISRIH